MGTSEIFRRPALRRAPAETDSQSPMDYEALFGQAVDTLHAERRYRVFTELARNCGCFPVADNFSGIGPEKITIWRSEEHTSELQSLMRISYAVFCLKKKKKNKVTNNIYQ